MIHNRGLADHILVLGDWFCWAISLGSRDQNFHCPLLRHTIRPE